MSRPGQLVDPVGLRTRAPVARDSWWIPLALGHKREWPRTAGPPQGPSDPGPRQPGELVDTEGLRTPAPAAWNSWSTLRTLGRKREGSGTAGPPFRPLAPGQSRPGYLVDPRGLGHGPESPLGPGRPRRPSEPGPSRQRHRVLLEGPGTRAQVARDCFSTPRALGQKRESPGSVARHRVPSVQGRVPWDRCSTPPHLARSRVSRDACRNRAPWAWA